MVQSYPALVHRKQEGTRAGDKGSLNNFTYLSGHWLIPKGLVRSMPDLLQVWIFYAEVGTSGPGWGYRIQWPLVLPRSKPWPPSSLTDPPHPGQLPPNLPPAAAKQ